MRSACADRPGAAHASVFTKLLAERLAMKSAIPVKEAVGGELLEPGTIWLAPGGNI